jgi:hypothetical protein
MESKTDIREIHINIDKELSIDINKLQKMLFIYNAIESGWSVHKNNQKYYFNKKHEGKKEVFLDSYLQEFIQNNASFNK